LIEAWRGALGWLLLWWRKLRGERCPFDLGRALASQVGPNDDALDRDPDLHA
jgi:hypothetical protein